MRHSTTTTGEPISWPPSRSDPQAASLPPQAFDQDSGKDDSDDASQLLSTALAWLREDKVVRLERERTSGKGPTRGAKAAQQDQETDSE